MVRHRQPGRRLEGRETLLLVDDEEMILTVGTKMLERLGYTVRTALTGQEALDIYRREGDAIALVILDMIMPFMSGSELFARLKALDPEVKALLSSGYSLDGQAAEILDRGCNGFIQKPYTLDALSRRSAASLTPKGQAVLSFVIVPSAVLPDMHRSLIARRFEVAEPVEADPGIECQTGCPGLSHKPPGSVVLMELEREIGCGIHPDIFPVEPPLGFRGVNLEAETVGAATVDQRVSQKPAAA